MSKLSRRGIEWERKLLAVLMEHTCKNALEVARDTEYWAEENGGEGEETRQEFIEAIVRCQEGNGTDEDWDWLVSETQM